MSDLTQRCFSPFIEEKGAFALLPVGEYVLFKQEQTLTVGLWIPYKRRLALMYRI